MLFNSEDTIAKKRGVREGGEKGGLGVTRELGELGKKVCDQSESVVNGGCWRGRDLDGVILWRMWE